MSSQKALTRLMGAPAQKLPSRGILFWLRMNRYSTYAVPGYCLGAAQGDHGFVLMPCWILKVRKLEDSANYLPHSTFSLKEDLGRPLP